MDSSANRFPLRLLIALSILGVVPLLDSSWDRQAVKALKPDVRKIAFEQDIHISKEFVTAQVDSKPSPNHVLQKAEKLDRQVAHLYRKGLFSKAIPVAEHALRSYEKALGLEDSGIVDSINQLAHLYQLEGNYPQAESLYQTALSIREKALSPNDPKIVESLNNLAFVYQLRSNYSQAELLYVRSIRIWDNSRRPKHPTFATSFENYADLHLIQGNYLGAERLYQRALRIFKERLGPNHPSVASCLNGLALLYQAQGNYSQAKTLFQESLDIRKSTLASNHPDIAVSLSNLAVLYKEQGIYSQARPLFIQAISLLKAQFGSDHPNVGISLNHLAELYSHQGKDSLAKSLFEQALHILENKLGSEHPSFASSLNGLAELYLSQERYAQAQPLFEKALGIFEKAVSYDHPAFSNTLNNLAILYNLQGDTESAYKFLYRATAIDEQRLDRMIHGIGSESRKQAYITSLSEKTSTVISFHLKDSVTHQPAAQLALNTILRRKGRVLDSLTDRFAVLRSLYRHLDPNEQKLIEQLEAIHSEYSAHILKNNHQRTLGKHQGTLMSLKTQAEDIENQLDSLSSRLLPPRQNNVFQPPNPVVHGVATQSISIANIQKLIPKEAALIELIRYYPLNSEEIKHWTLDKLHADIACN